MQSKRKFLISAQAQDLAWVTPIIETLGLGVEIKDFALPADEDGSRERAFELWHMWREAATRKVPMIIHMPFLDLVPGSPDPEVVGLARKQHQMVLTLAETLGVNAVLFHSGFNPLIKGPDYFPRWLHGTADYFRRFLEEFPSQEFLVENMWEPYIDPLSRLIDEVNNPRLKLCIDVGHTMIYGHDAPEQWIRNTGMRLGLLHCNDNIGDWDQELAVGSGKAPWDKIFRTLDALGYFGLITLEMHGEESIHNSITYLQGIGRL